MGKSEVKGGVPAGPRLGVLFVTSGWFRAVGLQSAEGDTSAAAETTALAVRRKLEGFCRPVTSGVVYSREEALKAGREIRAADVDAVLLVPLMWCEDEIPRAALGLLADVPLILWSFSPSPSLPDYLPFQTMLRGSGTVCSMQLSGMLKREGVRYHAVAGHADDEQVYKRISALASAAAIRRELSGLRIGVLPFPCNQMSTTYVDEFALRARYGLELRYLELERVRGAAADADPAAVRLLRSQVASSGALVAVDERNLVEGIRYALAMERVMAEERLAALAMNDVIPEMHASFGLRPCLWNPAIGTSGAVVAMEADIAAAAAMLVLRRATAQSPFYTEPFGIDWARNTLLLGHAGYHDGANADPGFPLRVVPDVEYENTDRFTGAVSYFKYRAGPVTIVNSVWSGGSLKWVCAEGESLAGPPCLEGNCHALVRADVPVRTLVERSLEDGVSQHWTIVPGRRRQELALLCGVLGIGFQSLEASDRPAGA